MVPIQLAQLRKTFGSTVAVESVDLSIPEGALWFLLGPSGCGKTTILRMIAGFLEPSGGSVRFGPRDVTGLAPEKRNAGMVFQSYALWPHLTVAENVAFGLRVRKVPAAERSRRVAEALEMVRMGPFAERTPNQLSGGQQQRVALARAIVFKPEVLLLDEPLSNLDAKLRLEMRHEIRRICTELRMTTVYVTHDRDEAMSMADGMVVLRDGRIEQQGMPRDLYERPRNRFVAEFLGETNFLQGRVAGESAAGGAGAGGAARPAGAVTVETPAGPVTAAAADPATAGERPGGSGPVWVSIRPEALRIHAGDGGPAGVAGGAGAASGAVQLRGTVEETIYLGGTAQHVVRCGGAALKVMEANPGRSSRAGEPVRLEVDPRQVVLLRE